MTDMPPVVLSSPQAGVGLIQMNRPERLNALNLDVKRRIADAIEVYSADPTISVIIIAGDEKAFIAGTDLSEMADMEPADHERLGTNDMFVSMRACEKILVAAVEGYALGGGCETALNCDVIFAAESAKFGQPEIRVGIMAGAGGTQILTRAAGRHRAMKYLLTGEHFSAQFAYDLGIVSEVVADGGALEASLAFAATVAKRPPIAVQQTKKAVMLSQNSTLTDGLSGEREAFVSLFSTEDQAEGMKAFLSKRSPEFKGR